VTGAAHVGGPRHRPTCQVGGRTQLPFLQVSSLLFAGVRSEESMHACDHDPSVLCHFFLFFPLYLRGFGTSSSSFLCLLAADWPMGDDLAARGKLGFSIRVM
jgi:hypothetical protein